MLRVVVDQEWTNIYGVTDGAHIGIVDEGRAYHQASSTRPVMVTLVVSGVDAWYRYFKEKGWRPLMSRMMSRIYV